MNRTLTAVLAAAAVVGASSGTVVATRMLAHDPTTPATSTGPGDPGPTSAAALVGTPGDLLWATASTLHDGPTVVRYHLPGPVVSVQRAAGGWVVATSGRLAEPHYTVQLVHPDGSLTPVADTFDRGDVSPDGTRYVAMAYTGRVYRVWDVATGDVVDEIGAGRTPDQFPTGGASFGPDGPYGPTVITGWSGTGATDDGATDVLRSALDTGPTEVVSDDVTGPWNVSPDGAVLAYASAASNGGTDRPACAALTAVVEPADIREDCQSTFAGVPSANPDGSSVVAVPVGTEGLGPTRFRVLHLDAAEDLVKAPTGSLTAAFLDADHLAVLATNDGELEGTRIYRCPVVTGSCRLVVNSGSTAAGVVLGTL